MRIFPDLNSSIHEVLISDGFFKSALCFPPSTVVGADKAGAGVGREPEHTGELRASLCIHSCQVFVNSLDDESWEEEKRIKWANYNV